jgi:hypothetical protein
VNIVTRLMNASSFWAFPDQMEPAIITEIMRGRGDPVMEAGMVIAGGRHADRSQ